MHIIYNIYIYINIFTVIQESVCSHGRSHAFLIESVVNAATGNCSFVGYKWDRKSKHVGKILNQKCVDGFCTEMGVNSGSYYPNNPGIFYVPTQEKQPFCGKSANSQI